MTHHAAAPRRQRMAAVAVCMVACMASVPAAAQPAVSAGRYHNLGLSADGRVFWWGTDAGTLQMLNRRVAPTLPQPVEGLPPAVAVAAGWTHSSAIARDGSVWEWGFSPYRMRQVYLLQPLPGPCAVAAVLSGGHGKDPCSEEKIARAQRMRVDPPLRIPGLPPAAAIAASDSHSAIIARDGSVYCWGPNAFPTKIAGLERIKAIALGQFHGVALREDGVVLGWGSGSGGGVSYQPTRSAGLCGNPEPRPFFSGAVAIAAFADSTFALRADGSVWAWGSSWNGNPPLPKDDNPANIPDAFVARRVATLDGAVALGGGRDPAVLTRAGLVTSWRRDYPSSAGVRAQPGVEGIAALSSYSSILALRSDGVVCTMGSNMYGATLPGDASPEIARFIPVPLGDGRGVLNLADAGRTAPPGVCASLDTAPAGPNAPTTP